MMKIDTWHGLAAALSLPLPPAVRTVLAATGDRLEEFRDRPLNELCTVLILEPPDRLAALEAELCFPFDPAAAEYIDHHDGWYELVFVTGDDGFGYVVLVEDRTEMDPAILEHCRAMTD